ncbi:hypothetical protein HY636_06370 [Candidatus Woesearchaeota archaeon]|nr:hypothetical protein [Candidatus Woesearchaeota archaeon]
MYYLAAFWILFLIFFLVYLVSSLFKIKKLQRRLDEYGILFVMALGSLVIVAIASKDPIAVGGIEIPVELQWFASLFVTIFGMWRFFLNPLKKKVYRMDREMGEVRATISNLDKTVDKLERNVDKLDGNIDKILYHLLIKDKIPK